MPLLPLGDTHYYGGVKKYQWVTIPLALVGVVCKKDGSVVEVNIGEDPKDPVVGVTDLLIHLAADQMAKPQGGIYRRTKRAPRNRAVSVRHIPAIPCRQRIYLSMKNVFMPDGAIPNRQGTTKTRLEIIPPRTDRGRSGICNAQSLFKLIKGNRCKTGRARKHKKRQKPRNHPANPVGGPDLPCITLPDVFRSVSRGTFDRTERRTLFHILPFWTAHTMLPSTRNGSGTLRSDNY